MAQAVNVCCVVIAEGSALAKGGAKKIPRLASIQLLGQLHAKPNDD
jgi:hypothetical protein